MIVELEVEVTRTEIVRFEYNPEDDTMIGEGHAIGAPSLPRPVGQFMRLLTYYTHKPKNLAKSEKVALKKYRVLTDEEAQKAWKL